MNYFLILIFAVLVTSCNAQVKKADVAETESKTEQKSALQIGTYVTGIYEETNGHLWFGTLEKGIARYDGKNLKYFTKKDGLPSDRVTSVTRDATGIYWFNTGEGLSKLGGSTFTNYTVKKGDFYSNVISRLLIDSKGKFWVGTWGGVYNFDGTNFTYFPIPFPTVTTKINEDTKNWITDIKEDAAGNIWFARDGFGACKYDGHQFTHFLKKDGLHSNNLTEIEFDKKGNIWFGTRVAEKDNPDPKQRVGRGGVNIYNGTTIDSFPQIKGFNDGDVYEIFRDNTDNIWIGTVHNGVYKFDGTEFKNYAIPISIMSIKQDKNGNLWFAGAGGLYKMNLKEEIVNVMINGPWK